IVDCARFAPTGSNLQPVKYIIVQNEQLLGKVFDCTSWAGYLHGKGTPGENERPKAYIVVLADTTIRESNFEYDVGAAVMTIIYAALSKGIGSCWIGSAKQDRLRDILKISENLSIESVVALGFPAEQPVAEEFIGDIKYYKDEKAVIHVPKRKLSDVIIK
ncbi:MAG: nitroreductase, partial [Clostridiaceae bacterium]|nr:nitroreductase [Clostridiaceae bacterium]